MASFIERVKAAGLPLDQIVVIGSGLLDAWGLRTSADVDLVVSTDLFERLKQDTAYAIGEKNSQHFLRRGELEIWEDWGGRTLSSLLTDAVTIDEVSFVNPDFLIERKQQRGFEKDARDIALLQEYLNVQK